MPRARVLRNVSQFLRCLLAAGVVSLAGSHAILADEPYGRACLVVEEPSQADPQQITTTAFDERSTPGADSRLALYVDASVDASVLVAFFDHDRKLANGWPAQLVQLKAWKERRLPLSPVAWTWTPHTPPFDGYVLFLMRHDEQLGTLERLVGAMQDPKTDAAMLEMQAKKLRELILQGMTGDQPAAFHAGSTPQAWGGTLRGEEFPWPKQAQKAVFGPTGRAALTYRHGE